VRRWLGIFKFLELSNFLFYGTFDVIKICIKTFKAQCSRFFLSLTLMI
jgi:hypothetical protein